MEVKILEVRDRMTFIPVMAISLDPDNHDQQRLLWAAGYGGALTYVLLVNLNDSTSKYAPHSWGGRTMPAAHSFILSDWNDLNDGDVIDVEYILGETTTKKEPE